jgi:glycerol-3-phosphate dehydrogenase
VLVFPTVDHEIVAGPTARERVDKEDWSVEPDASDLILARATSMYPALARAKPLGSYAGLRPAGRVGNYVITDSRTLPGLVHVAAIRSTGLSASLGIGEHVVAMLAAAGHIEPASARPLPAPPQPPSSERWWRRAALHRERAAGNAEPA